MIEALRCAQSKVEFDKSARVTTQSEISRARAAHVVFSRYSLELAFSMLLAGTANLNSGPKYSM